VCDNPEGGPDKAQHPVLVGGECELSLRSSSNEEEPPRRSFFGRLHVVTSLPLLFVSLSFLLF